MFKQAVKHEAKLRLAIAGPSGSGKTYTALSVATSLGKTAVVDTEHGSASKYADLFQFDVLNLEPPFHPDKFIEAIAAAAKANYDTVVIDSLSHAWSGAGGVLEIVDQAQRKYGGNKYYAWADGTPIQNRLIEAIVGSRIHIIATMRSKEEYVEIDDGKRKSYQKVGTAPVQREGMPYEFDVMIDMTIKNDAVVTKSRCPALNGAVMNKPGADLAAILQNWLSGAPAPSRDDILADMAKAQTLRMWSSAAYALPEVKNAFESVQRVEDWYGFAVGDFDASHNGRVTTALKKYTDMVADGEKVKTAAEASRQTFQDSKPT